jgi:hypothetical protein
MQYRERYQNWARKTPPPGFDTRRKPDKPVSKRPKKLFVGPGRDLINHT